MALRRCNARDLVSMTSREITREGYLKAPAAIGRTGVQEYRARELGLDADGVPADKIIRLHRPSEEVFAPETLASFDGQPITDDHPPEDVTSETWDEYAVGDTRGVSAQGDKLAATVMVRDKACVAKVIDGKSQLSCGYSFDLDMTSGTTADGQAYDGVQRAIRGNHVAIVDYARGGPGCRIADSTNPNTGDRAMSLRNIRVEDQKFSRVVDHKITEVVLPGFEIDLDISTPVGLKAADAIDRFTRGMKDCMAAHDSVKAEVGVHKERADAAEKRLHELDSMEVEPDEDDKEGKETKKAGDRAASRIKRLAAKAKDAVSEKAIEALATERARVVADALVLLPEFEHKGKTLADIRAEVLTSIIAADGTGKAVALAVLGGAEPAKAAKDVARTAFDAVVAAHGPASVDDADAVDAATSRALAGDGDAEKRTRAAAADDEPTGRDAMMASLSWSAVQKRLAERQKQ